MRPGIPFLATRRGRGGEAGILGAPLDLTESFRDGTRAAPRQVRLASDSIETYSPLLELDLEDFDVVDWGDVELAGLTMEPALRAIEQRFAEVLFEGFGLLLGGEHTVALAGLRAARRLHPGTVLVQYDAHLDIREEYEGHNYSHATWVHRAAQECGYDHVVQLGIRSGAREEFRRARACLYSSSEVEIPPRVREALTGVPLYVSVDIDVLDPGIAPGTGCPEPGGVSFRELIASLHSLRGLHVVGADICEVLPEVDPADITAVAAAKIARELILICTTPAGRRRIDSEL